MKPFTTWLRKHPVLALVGAACLTLAVPSASAPQPAPIQSIAGFAAAGPRLVPFAVEVPGGMANSAAVGSANPEIILDCDGDDGHLIVSSILIKSNVPSTGFQFFRVNDLTLNGTEFDTRTINLIGLTDGSGVNESADLMGTPVRAGSTGDTGGCFPREIIAENAGTDNVRVRFFARSDDSDLSVSTVRVSGWKRAEDTITLTYVPGN